MEKGTTTPSPASLPPLPRPPISGDKDSTFSPAVVTYIVQVPKEQIYRVPPKENARLAEQYRAHLAAGGRKLKISPFLNLSLRLLCIFIAVTLPLLIATLVFYILIRPSAPIFNIDRVLITKSKNQCEIFMDVTNPSLGMAYMIEKGVAKIGYKEREFADGETPKLNLKARLSRKLSLELHGVKKAVLEEAEKVRLTVGMPVRVEIWGMTLWRMKMKVECDVKVKKIGSGKTTKTLMVISEECKVGINLLGL